MSKIFKAFLSTTAITIVILSVKAFAQTTDIGCPECGWFGKAQDTIAPGLELTKVTSDMSSMTSTTMLTLTNSSYTETMNCGEQFVSDNPTLLAKVAQYSLNKSDEAVCSGLDNQFEAFNTPEGKQQFANSKVAGSLLGAAYYMQNTAQYEPVPVNMAYFFMDYAKKVPIIGERAYAATGISYANLPLLDDIKIAWQVVQRAAYGLMAIIMLYVGFTIISRRRINQQVVVNVQYALPKVIMAIVFIAFSYPISATIISLAWALYHSTRDIIATLVTSAGGTGTAAIYGLDAGMGVIIFLVTFIVLFSSGVGAAVGIALSIAIGIILIMYLALLLKTFFILFKMIMATITGPIQIAWSAIPGNEDKLIDWFKHMFAWGLGIVAIGATANLVKMIGVSIIISMFQNGNAIQGTFFALLGAPLILIFGFGYAFSIPGKIENAIIGDTKKGGKR